MPRPACRALRLSWSMVSSHGATRCLSVVEPETGSGRGSANTTTPPSFNSVLFDCVSQPSATIIAGLDRVGLLDHRGRKQQLDNGRQHPRERRLPGDGRNCPHGGQPDHARRFLYGSELHRRLLADGNACLELGCWLDPPASPPPAGCPTGTTEAAGDPQHAQASVFWPVRLAKAAFLHQFALPPATTTRSLAAVDVGVDRGADGTGGASQLLSRSIPA